MAELSEADKRIMLGKNYKEEETNAQQEGRSQRAPEKLWTDQVQKHQANKFNAFAMMAVGTILLVSNLSAVTGPPVMLVSLFGILLFAAGAGWFAYILRSLKKLRANPPSAAA